MRPLGVALAVVLVVGAARSAAAETRPAYGGELVAGLLSEPVTVDPVVAVSHAELTLVGLLYDTLYRIDEKGRVVEHLAAGAPLVADDGLTARIPVRSGVVFHDGASVRPADVAASLRRLQASGAGWLLAPVQGIAVEGDEVVLSLRRRAPQLAASLAAPQAAVTPKGAAPAERRPIGSGPFRLHRLDRRDRALVVHAFDLHFAGRPYVDILRLTWHESTDAEARAYEAGRSHLSLRGAIAFAGHQPKYATGEVEGPATLLVFAGFGDAHRDVTRNKAFRRALHLALGRTTLRSIGAGERVVPCRSPVPRELGGPAAADRERDDRLTPARAALAEAAREVRLLRDALDGRKPLTLEVIIDRSRPDDREVAEKLVDALYRLGLGARITDLSPVEFDRRVRRGQMDLYVGQVAPPTSDPAAMAAAAFAAGGDDWATTALAAAPLDLTRALQEFERRLPIVPLFHRAVRVHHRTDVRGVGLDLAGRLTLPDLFLFGQPKRGGRS